MAEQYNGNVRDALAEQVCERFNEVKRERTVWESHWEDCARFVLPRYVGTFTTPEKVRPEGNQNVNEIFDSTAVKALPMFAATMESLLTPRSQRWHKLRASDQNLMKNLRVRQWFDTVTDTLFRYRYAPDANYASAKHEDYISLGAFGTGGVLIEPNQKNRGLRYQALHLGGLYLVQNGWGLIDTVYREFALTGQQAVDLFGVDALPKAMRDDYEKGRSRNKKWEFIHFIGPRNDYDPGRLDARGMRFESIYVASSEKKVVRKGGYRTFPIPISRYITAPGEVYGRSVAMQALPAIKTLNEEKKTTLKAGHRAVDPPLLAFDDGTLDTVSLKPGALNFGGVSPEGRPLIQPMLTGNNFSVAYQLMDIERKDINDTFLVSLYDILIESPEMTATQVLQRVREKGNLLAPSMGRHQSENLGPAIDREIDILANQGLLPPMPPELAEAAGEYDVVYDSPMARAQRAEEATGAMQYLEFAGAHAAATGDPSFFDYLDVDAAAPELMWIMSVPAGWQASPETVSAKRDARAQQAQAQMAVEAAPAAASMAKTMGG